MNKHDNEVLTGSSHFDTHAEESLRFYRGKSGQVLPTVLSEYDQIWGFYYGCIFIFFFF